MVLAIRFWFKVDYCFIIMIYDGLVYYLIFIYNIIMTTSVSRRFNIYCIMFKNIAYFIITLFVLLYMRVGIFLTCEKHWHDASCH